MFLRSLVTSPSVPGIVMLIALAVVAFAFGDALLRRSASWLYAGHNRAQWLALTGAAFVVQFIGFSPLGGGFGSFLSIAALVAATVYLVKIRVDLRTYRPPRSTADLPRDSWR